MTDYLTLENVVAIHADRMKRLGREPAPLRDEEALRGVVRLPEAAVHYDDADLIKQAAIVAVGIAHLKPFTAGNYLTAFAAMEVFLGLNRYVIREEGPDLAMYLRLVAGEHDLDHALTLFEGQLRRRASQT